jgi:hypothetical protein
LIRALSAPPRRLDGCDVDLSHGHHRVECPLGGSPIGVGYRFDQRERSDLP